MGVDYYAYTIIGLQLCEKDLIGKDDEYIDEYWDNDCDDGGVIVLSNVEYNVTKLGNYYYVIGQKDVVYDDGNGCAFKKCKSSLEELCEIKKKMSDNLGRISLWSDNKFGIYTISECSF
jgi:hypothetical protein